jgi:hypothetical protein
MQALTAEQARPLLAAAKDNEFEALYYLPLEPACGKASALACTGPMSS